MQFILNTSFDPHFCALFDSSNVLIAEAHWDTPKEDGARVWDFLAQHLKPTDTLSFIGGITGPGSFSSLRTASSVLNVLSFKYGRPIHQARADLAVQDYLTTQNLTNHPFLLNSFSQRVFLPINQKLKVLEREEALITITEPVITSWLPAIKAEGFNAITVDPLGPLHTLLGTLKNTMPQPQFVPDYEYPPVQQ